MDLNFQQIDEYLHTITPDRDEVLSSMEEYAAQHSFPIVGPLVGRLLFQMAKATKSKRIFELGSGYGYSAIWFARGGGPNCQVVCTDGDENNRRLARSFFRRTKVSHQIDFRVGMGQEILEEFPANHFDIIYNDIDKFQYPSVVDLVLSRLRKGGLLITDNLLWSGKVLEEVSPEVNPNTAGIQEFTRLIYENDDRLYSTIIPLRDGVSISVKR